MIFDITLTQEVLEKDCFKLTDNSKYEDVVSSRADCRAIFHPHIPTLLLFAFIGRKPIRKHENEGRSTTQHQ